MCAAMLYQGYTPISACELMHLTAHLSRWMQARGLESMALTEPVLTEFLDERRLHYGKRRTPRALVPLLGHLRAVGAAPEAPVPVDASEMGVLLAEYQKYLRDERGVAKESIRRCLPPIRAFLATVPAPLEQGLAALTAEHVTRFVMEGAARRSTADAKSMVTSLRSLLRFLFVTDRISRPLAEAVPTVANRKLAALPGHLTAGQATTLLSGCDRTTPTGRRDFAVLTLLSRLGLRACEAAAVEISDVDWRSGELTVRGKGGLTDRLPLPADVGEAWPTTCCTAVPATAPPPACSSPSAPHDGPSMPAASGPSWPVAANGPACRGSPPTGCVTPWPATCWPPGRRW
ncbi:hypothetical protein ABZ698_40585 [Streptomyces antibioticus]